MPRILTEIFLPSLPLIFSRVTTHVLIFSRRPLSPYSALLMGLKWGPVFFVCVCADSACLKFRNRKWNCFTRIPLPQATNRWL